MYIVSKPDYLKRYKVHNNTTYYILFVLCIAYKMLGSRDFFGKSSATKTYYTRQSTFYNIFFFILGILA